MVASKHWLLCRLNDFKMKSKKLQMMKDPMYDKLMNRSRGYCDYNGEKHSLTDYSEAAEELNMNREYVRLLSTEI